MILPKSAILAAFCAFTATPILADAGGADYKANLYDADYEIVLADQGYQVGVSVYGASDADYDAFFATPATFNPMKTTADAGYEAILAERGIFVGSSLYGAYDADYETILAPKDDCQNCF